ncbi:MAG: FtsW/RodA/SpoVE family cell cycle protein, partial [Rhodospirillales bacterium]
MAGLVAAVLMSPYRIDRVRAFLDPWQDPLGIGYHVIQSMVTVAGGGVAGRGLGNSIQKFGYLPEDTTDFIFAIISEELGLIGVTVVVCLYG